ncbi:Ig-like domain-containing protein [Flavobacterium hauense]
MKITTFKSLFKTGGRNFAILASLLLAGGTASAQISAYSRTQLSGQTYTQISGGTVINTDAQLTSGGNQDSGAVLVTLPFTFTYDGNPFTQVTFSTNGWVAMGNQVSAAASVAATLFNVNAPNNNLAPWIGNLGGNWPMPAGNGSMVHGTVGTGVYAFEWRNINSSSTLTVPTTVDNVNFMVLLYGPASATPGRIEFLYGAIAGNVLTGASKAIGIKNSVGGNGNYLNALNGSSYVNSNPSVWPGSGNGYRFDVPVACNDTPTGGTLSSDTNMICTGAAVPLLYGVGTTVGTGLTYQWEESTNGGTSWANATGGTGATTMGYTPPVFAGTAIRYRLKVTCTASGLTAYSASSLVNPVAAPTTQVTGLSAIKAGNAATLIWTPGNGGRRLVIMSTSPIVDPVNGAGIPTYAANAVWQNAGQQIMADNAIATSTSTAVSGLTCGTTYYVKMYEYNRCGSTPSFTTYINTVTGTNGITFVATPVTAAALPLTVNFQNFDATNPGINEVGWYAARGTTGAIEPSAAPTTMMTSSWTAAAAAATTQLGIPTIKHTLFNNTQNGWIISPKIVLTSASRLKFKAAITDSGVGTADPDRMMGTDDKVKVLVSTDGCGAVWTPIYTFDATNTASLTNVLTDYVISLGAYTGQTIQLAFQATSGPVNNAGINCDFHIGALLIEPLPPCAAPVLNDVTGVTKNSATISWQLPAAGTPTAYEYAVATTNTPPASGTETTQTAISLTPAVISPATTYYVFVRTKCTDVYSDWSVVKIFMTLCDYPDLLTSAGDTACGLGEATLTATASPGGIINWYAATTGGAPLASGASYNVSGLQQTTNYYVSTATPVASQTAILGAATGFSPAAGVSPYYNSAGGVKTQYIIRASELQAIGLYAGPINSLAISVGNPGTNVYNGFAVSIGHTAQNQSTSTHIGGLTTVYSNALQILTTGFNTYAFTTPFIWDGTSNLVVQICYSNNDAGNADPTSWSNVNSYATGFTSSTCTRDSFVTADAICGAPGEGGIGITSTATSRPLMSFNGTKLCSGPRVMVTVTVNDAPDIVAVVSDNTICLGESTNLNVTSANAGYTYNWMPGNLAGAAQTVSPTENTTYTVTATDAASGCVEVAEVEVVVNALPAAITVTASSDVVCQNSVVALTASESGPDYVWSPAEGLFTDEAATIAYTGTPAATVYYYADADASFTVSVTNANGCTIAADIDVTVTIIAAPEANASQTICNAGTIADLQTTTSEEIKWYADASGGEALDNTTVLVDGEHYFASQTVNGCESVARTEVTVAINVVAAPEANASQTICNAGTVADLQTTSGENITWYTDAEGGDMLDADDVLTNDEDYFASQTVNGCESAVRTSVTVVINTPAAPTGAATQAITADIATDATLEDVVIEGVTGTVTWYATLADAQDGENALDVTTQILNDEDYFATQTINGCTSLDVFAVTIDLTLGSDRFDVKAFTYSPNPVKNVLTLSYSSAIDTVTVYNMLGQTVLSQRFDATQANVDMINLADGTYMLKVTSGEVSKTVKVLKVQ